MCQRAAPTPAGGCPSWQGFTRGSCGHSERIAPSLYDLADGEPGATASVNLPEIALGPDEVIINDYSENEGMVDDTLGNRLAEQAAWSAVTDCDWLDAAFAGLGREKD